MSSTLITDIGSLATNDPALGAGPLGLLADAAIALENGRVAWVGPASAAPAADEVVAAGGAGGDPRLRRLARPPGLRRGPHRRVQRPDVRPRLQRGRHPHHRRRDPRRHRRRARRQRRPATSARPCARAPPCWSASPATASPSRTRPARCGSPARHTDEVTYLGAHVVAPEYAEDPAGYVDLVTGPMLDACAPHARWVDVFCERGAFDGDQARRGAHRRDEARPQPPGPRQPARPRARACSSRSSSARPPPTTAPTSRRPTSTPWPPPTPWRRCSPAPSSPPAPSTPTRGACWTPERPWPCPPTATPAPASPPPSPSASPSRSGRWG